jgi:F0F1-type ATP synthase assembly protein I
MFSENKEPSEEEGADKQLLQSLSLNKSKIREYSNKLTKEKRQTRKYLNLSTELFAAVLIGAFLGWYLDQLLKLKTPWFMISGIFLGAVAGFRDLYRAIIKEEQEEKRQNK